MPCFFLTCQQLRLGGLDGGVVDNLGVCTSMLCRKDYSIFGEDVLFSFFIFPLRYLIKLLTSVFIYFSSRVRVYLLARGVTREGRRSPYTTYFYYHRYYYFSIAVLLLQFFLLLVFLSFLYTYSHPKREWGREGGRRRRRKWK